MAEQMIPFQKVEAGFGTISHWGWGGGGVERG